MINFAAGFLSAWILRSLLELRLRALSRRHRSNGNCRPMPPAPGTRRIYFDQPAQMAECGGPCWETRDPRCCDCGALWRDVPIRLDEGTVLRLDEGTVQRGNGSGGPTTPKPPIKPQFPPPRKLREDFL